MAAELPIVIKDLDQNAVRAYLRSPDLMAALDEYILFADRQLIKRLMELADLQKKVQPSLKVTELYRGSGNWGPQEDLGSKGTQVGDVREFTSPEKVVSTSMSLEIAQAFGPTVLKITPSEATRKLIVSDELSYIISRRRNLDVAMTQKEVILLPPIGLTYTVLQQKKKGLFW